MEEPRTLTPAEILDIVRRRKWSLVLPAALIVLAGLLVAFLLPPIYKSSATILIEEQEIPAEFVMTTVTSFAEQRIQQITQRIMSFSRLLEIIQRFRLYPEMLESRTTEEIVEQMRKDTELKPVSADVIDRRTGRPTAATIAFSLAYQGRNPQTVQQVASTLTSLYLEENLKVRTKQAAEATEFLEGEMARVKEELAEIEAKLSAFKERHINELPEMMQVNVQALATIERNLELAEGQLRSQKEREGFLQTQLVGVKPRMEKEDILISRKHLEELRIQLGNLTQRFSDEHPDVKKTRTEIRDLEKRVEALEADNRKGGAAADNPAYVTLASQLAGVRAEMDAVRRQIAELNRSAETYRRRIAATPKVEEEYSVLLVARSGTQAKVNDLMKKLMEARVAHGLEREQKGERFTLVEPPRLPEKPFKPNRLAIVLIAVVLGTGAGVGLAALREFGDDSVHGAAALEERFGQPVLAGIPVILTAADIRRRLRARIGLAGGALGAVLAGAAVVHLFVMDLDVLWVRLMRKLAL
jgi:polysaccharide chain length determinant protein (PEP-CTERM system associated)